MKELLQAVHALAECPHEERTKLVVVRAGEEPGERFVCAECGVTLEYGGWEAAPRVRALRNAYRGYVERIETPHVGETLGDWSARITKSAGDAIATMLERTRKDEPAAPTFESVREKAYPTPEERAASTEADAIALCILSLLETREQPVDRVWIVRSVQDSMASDPHAADVVSALISLVASGQVEQLTSAKGTFYRLESRERVLRTRAAPPVPAKITADMAFDAWNVSAAEHRELGRPELSTVNEVEAWIEFATTKATFENLDYEELADEATLYADMMLRHLRRRLSPTVARALVGTTWKAGPR